MSVTHGIKQVDIELAAFSGILVASETINADSLQLGLDRPNCFFLSIEDVLWSRRRVVALLILSAAGSHGRQRRGLRMNWRREEQAERAPVSGRQQHWTVLGGGTNAVVKREIPVVVFFLWVKCPVLTSME